MSRVCLKRQCCVSATPRRHEVGALQCEFMRLRRNAYVRRGDVSAYSKRQNRGGIAAELSATPQPAALILPRFCRCVSPSGRIVAEACGVPQAPVGDSTTVLPLFCRAGAMAGAADAANHFSVSPPAKTNERCRQRNVASQHRAFAQRHTATTTPHDDAAARAPRTPQQASQLEVSCNVFFEPTSPHVVNSDRAPTAPPQPVRGARRPERMRGSVRAANIRARAGKCVSSAK